MSKAEGNGDAPKPKGKLRDLLAKIDKSKTVKERLELAEAEQKRHAGVRAARERARQARVRARDERKGKGK